MYTTQGRLKPIEQAGGARESRMQYTLELFHNLLHHQSIFWLFSRTLGKAVKPFAD
jgi:hypothetical protein